MDEKERRINHKMHENLDKDELQRSYGYCKAYVEGEMGIEERVKMQNKLMTKAEAIEAHAKTQANSMVEYWSDTKAKSKLFIKGLEALGLIEFKEEEKELSTKITEAGKFGIREETVLKVIDSIALAGYKIVPK